MPVISSQSVIVATIICYNDMYRCVTLHTRRETSTKVGLRLTVGVCWILVYINVVGGAASITKFILTL